MEIINGTLGILIKNSTTSSSSRKVEFVKLRKNTNYTVRVYARNVVNYGKAAEIVTKTKFVGRCNCDTCHFIYMYGVYVLSIPSGLFECSIASLFTVQFDLLFCYEVQCPDRWPAKK